MITLKTLRFALQASDPHDEMDRLVRLELFAGRTTKEVFEQLNTLVEAAQGSGLTTDGEEALFGTLDALTGNCHPACQYHDRPAATVTAPEETSRPSPD